METISNATSSGPFPVKTDFFKKMAIIPDFFTLLTLLFNFVYNTGQIPKSWITSALTAILQPAQNSGKLSPIAVTPLPFRILSSILAQRFELFIGLNEDQFAFWKNRSRSLYSDFYCRSPACNKARCLFSVYRFKQCIWLNCSNKFMGKKCVEGAHHKKIWIFSWVHIALPQTSWTEEMKNPRRIPYKRVSGRAILALVCFSIFIWTTCPR